MISDEKLRNEFRNSNEISKFETIVLIKTVSRQKPEGHYF